MVQGSRLVEDHPGLLVECRDDASVARAKVRRRTRQIGGAAQQAKTQRLALSLDGRQVNPSAMGLARLVGLRQQLEVVLGTDPVEGVELGLEETPVEHADTMDENRNSTHAHDRPGQAGDVVARELPDHEYPRSRLQLVLEVSGLGDIPAQVDGLS